MWNSINLSNPEASWTTPAKKQNGEPTGKPSWQAANDPERIITDPAEVEVIVPVEVKRFRIGIRLGDQGLSYKVTDGGSRRIRREVAKAREGAYYTFDYETQEAVIMKPNERTPLPDYIRSLEPQLHKEATPK